MSSFSSSDFPHPPPPDPESARRLARTFRLPEPLVTVLWRRGYRDEGAIRAFLHPRLQDLPDPDLMKGMREATTLLAETLEQGRPLVIYADYDADGLSAAALLYLYLQRLGQGNLHYLLPHRINDGYGLHAHLLVEMRRKLAAETTAEPLLITVDCGISDHQAVVAAHELGYRVIITDHHRPPAQLPPAAAVLNPRQAGCLFPDKDLAGVGVALYLLMGLRRRLVESGWATATQLPGLKDYLDLVALGTVADMVNLRGVNRILVKAGLEVMNAGGRPGLAALAAAAGKSRVGGRGEDIYAEDISYFLAPRINAAGRIAGPETAFRLLISREPGEAEGLAAELEELNRRRRTISDQIYQFVRSRVDVNLPENGDILIDAAANWHPGVLGIAATRLSREYRRPVILLNLEDGVAKGSGRSIAGLDLLAAVAGCGALLSGYGGHAAALGLTMAEDNLPLFRQQLAIEISRLRDDGGAKSELAAEDWFFPAGRIDLGLTDYYPLLEPFGPGNPEPLFKVRGKLEQPGVAGGNHLRFRWRQGEMTLTGIAFDLAATILPLARQNLELSFALQRNFYQGRLSWQINLSGISPSEGGGDLAE